MAFETVNRPDQVCRKTLRFPQLLRLFCTEFPSAKDYMLDIARIDMMRIKAVEMLGGRTNDEVS